MTGQCFVDTDILGYAYDRREPVKQSRSRDLLDYLAQRDAGRISTQVLAELFVAVTRPKSGPMLSAAEAYAALENYLRSWTVVEVTGLIGLEAARGVRDHQFSYFDAQIWATARLHQIPLVLSEDFSTGAVIEGVRFLNPLDPAFAIADWVR